MKKKLLRAIDSGFYEPNQVMDLLAGLSADEIEDEFPFASIGDTSTEHYDVAREAELLSQDDAFTGAILHSEE